MYYTDITWEVATFLVEIEIILYKLC